MDADNRQTRLLRAAISGDRAALLKLLSQSRQDLRERIRRRIPGLLQSTIDADDVVQEAHVEVFRHIQGFRIRDAPAFDRWVVTIAMRKLRDAVRRQRAGKRGAGRAAVQPVRPDPSESMIALLDLVAGSEPTPSRVFARREAVAIMERALAQLPLQYRDLLQAIYIDGRSTASVALELGRSEGAIRVACHKARRRLRAILGNSSRFFSKPG